MANRTESPRFASRASCVVLAAVFVCGLLQLGVRLRDVQVVAAADYSYASIRQSVRRVQVSGGRGRILDRRGMPLADNRLSLSIVCNPLVFQRRTWDGTVAEIERAIAGLSGFLNVPSAVTTRQIQRHVHQALALPLTVWRDIGDRELAVFSEHAREFPGFSVEESEERVYPNKSVGAHVIGYVGHDRARAVAGDERFSFFFPEMRGRAGLELYYDGFLCGVSGEKKVLVDARGFALDEWMVVEPSQGPDLHVTLDLGIQRVVEDQLNGVCGACAVIDPRNGDVLALASAPGFDPNEFVPSLSPELYRRYAEDGGKPLLNRAVGGTYAPGSTFKPITALAGLSLGYPAGRPYFCNGVFELGGMHLRCASRWGHGDLDLCHALMKSCNPFFCNLAAEAGTNALVRSARAFGLGAKTGIDFGVDEAGVVPDADWKQRRFGERWYPGDLVQMAIGQGMLLASPLQMAVVAGALGTGFCVTPHLKEGISSERRRLPFPAAHLDTVRKGMRMVVAGDGVSRGSGWRGGEGVPVPVSGKTGTAEVGRGERRRKNTWFVCFAPSDAPQVAVALVVENGESGGGTAAPRVNAILRHVFAGGEG